MKRNTNSSSLGNYGPIVIGVAIHDNFGKLCMAYSVFLGHG